MAEVSPSYRFILEQAQKAYEESSKALKEALTDKTVVGSIVHQTDQLKTQVKQMSETPKDSASFSGLKAQFIRFTKAQLAGYQTMVKVHEEGLKTIQLLGNAKDSCSQFNPKILHNEFERQHLSGLGINLDELDQKQSRISSKIAAYPFKVQMAELNEMVQKVAELISLLERSLNEAFFTKSSVEGTNERYKMFEQYYSNPYLLAALLEQDQQIKGTA